MFLMPGSRSRPALRQRDLLPYQLFATVTSANNLVITMDDVPGAPTPYLIFRDPTAANGDQFARSIPDGGQFIINSGNTLGTVSGVPFRLWVLGFDNGGGITLGAFQSVTGGGSPTALAALDESSVQTTTGGNGGSSAGTFYAAQTLSNRPFRILGYLEWSAGLVTAGTWNLKPTKIQLFGPGVKKPGDILQVVYATATASSTTTSSTFQSTITTIAISPSNAANVIKVDWSGPLRVDTGSAADAYAQMFRGSLGLGGIYVVDGNFASSDTGSAGGALLDAPGVTSSVVYTIKIKNDDGATTVRWIQLGQASLMATEIMA